MSPHKLTDPYLEQAQSALKEMLGGGQSTSLGETLWLESLGQPSQAEADLIAKITVSLEGMPLGRAKVILDAVARVIADEAIVKGEAAKALPALVARRDKARAA